MEVQRDGNTLTVNMAPQLGPSNQVSTATPVTHPDGVGVRVLGSRYQRARLGGNVKPHSAIHVSLVTTRIPAIHPPDIWVCLLAGCETGGAEGIGVVFPKAPTGEE